MRVWRVAHKTRMTEGFPSGPYCGDGDDAYEVASEGMMEAHCADADGHPAPHNRKSGLDTVAYGREVCAFDSLDALNTWFEPVWRRLMAEHGFQVWEYEVPDEFARVGRRGQTLIMKAHVALIGASPLNTEERA